MQRQMDCCHLIQKAMKLLKGKVQERIMNSINKIIDLDDEKYFRNFKFKQLWFA